MKKILTENNNIQIVEIIRENGNNEKAINYISFVPRLKINDKIIINTTAVDLNLGTGGYHFVTEKLSNKNSLNKKNKNFGHIMKLRYTPLQLKTLCLSEKQGEFHKEMKKIIFLDGMKVIFIPLHSLLAPLLISYNYYNKDKKIIFIMAEGGSLNLELSNEINQLKEKNLLDITITIANSFGGDFEAVNIFTALMAAKLMEADLVVVGIGPGHVGTNTVLGFSGVELAFYIQAVEILRGNPLLIPRISFADKRKRHYLISHHTITLLKNLVTTPIEVVFPDLKIIKRNTFFLKKSKHNLFYYNINKIYHILNESNYNFKSMGKNFKEDPIFFITAGLTVKRLLEFKRGD
ncbi:MAG: DUF3866 family protein [Bacillota bacterium]